MTILVIFSDEHRYAKTDVTKARRSTIYQIAHANTYTHTGAAVCSMTW